MKKHKKRYIPIKFLKNIFDEIKKESEESPSDSNVCCICGKKTGDYYLFKKNNKLYYYFKIKVRRHKITDNNMYFKKIYKFNFIDICDGCHLWYHLTSLSISHKSQDL